MSKGQARDGAAARTMPSGKGADKAEMSRALWTVARGRIEHRAAPLPARGDGEALVRTLFSGISRGTERLVLEGAVPASEHARMRAPRQQGDFPFPVKYGYCAAGIVEDGPADLVGRTVFCLNPHEERFVAPIAALAVVPANVPARRATLAANMETALNALWDGDAGPADRIVVVGAGVVGLLVGAVAARLPAAHVTIVDVDATRRSLVEALGAGFATPATAPHDADIVFHASVTPAGLATAIGCAGLEGTIVELSWYGDRKVDVALGDAFHSRRLRLVSSQVGHVSPGRRPRWDYRRRMAAALELLADPRLDALVAEEVDFEDAPREMPRILAPGAPGLAPVIRYPGA